MTAGGTPLAAIEASGLGVAMRQWLWLYPAVEVVHLAGIALLFGSIAVLDLRLLGLSRSIAVRRSSLSRVTNSTCAVPARLCSRCGGGNSRCSQRRAGRTGADGQAGLQERAASNWIGHGGSSP